MCLINHLNVDSIAVSVFLVPEEEEEEEEEEQELRILGVGCRTKKGGIRY